MKKNLKTSSPLKLRIGRLATWELSPEFSHYTQNKIALILTNWLLALQEIPVNYLIFWSLQQQKKRSLRKSYLKYKFLYKNIHLSLKKKVFLYSCKKKKKRKGFNFNLAKTKFWRPTFLVACQLGAYQFKWLPTGLHVHLPIFFLANKRRMNFRRFFMLKTGNVKKTKKSVAFIKKAKLQIFKLFFMKLFMERKLQALLGFPVLFNFRNLLYLSKSLTRLQTNQYSIKKELFFFKKEQFLTRTVFLFAVGLYFVQSRIIAQQVAMRLTRTRKHWNVLKQLKKIIHEVRLLSPETSGLQIDIYGKIGAQTRTKNFRIRSGQIPTFQTLGSKLHYTYVECFSFTGVFGIHVWLCAGI